MNNDENITVSQSMVGFGLYVGRGFMLLFPLEE